ncbi:hypothetical protein ACFFSH_00865 [Streptomyces filamentosus]|uniref:Uncharacterized protein n=1 Tax=Streptomyces filamentosus TaxID=67294 RepID=A0A919BLV7_STRFL|nr:hypothetical protein [Streptomyces filamentosus]GHF99967.1 hypothetical protein GCM10017667_33800 [Streptomyces filamentosus]
MPAPSTPASAPSPAAPSFVRSGRRARVPGPAASAPGKRLGGRDGEGGGDGRGEGHGEGYGEGPRAEWAPGPGEEARGAADPAGDVVRWAVFCCALVPLVLVAFGTSLGGAGGAALGLASVTAACRLLLRRAERGLRAEGAGGGAAGGRRRG